MGGGVVITISAVLKMQIEKVQVAAAGYLLFMSVMVDEKKTVPIEGGPGMDGP